MCESKQKKIKTNLSKKICGLCAAWEANKNSSKVGKCTCVTIHPDYRKNSISYNHNTAQHCPSFLRKTSHNLQIQNDGETILKINKLLSTYCDAQKKPSLKQLVKELERCGMSIPTQSGEDYVVDLFYNDLLQAKDEGNVWGAVCQLVHKTWCGKIKHREKDTRFGTVYVSNIDGCAKIEILCRFPLDISQLLFERMGKLQLIRKVVEGKRNLSYKKK